MADHRSSLIRPWPVRLWDIADRVRHKTNVPTRQMANRCRVHSFHTQLGDLATLTRNVVRLGRDRLTAILATALDLLGVTLTA